MKKLLIAIALILLAYPSWAGGLMMVGGGIPATAASFCAGTELFCSTFESATSWDATNGTSDCDGYDTDGDYCDGDTTTYKNGAKSFGIMGTNTYYVYKAFASADQTELYWEMWYYIASGTGSSFDGSTGVVRSDGIAIATIYNTWGNLYFVTKGGSTAIDTTQDVVADTWYHIGIYWKIETGDGTANNGIVRVWVNTDGGTFDAGDIKYNSTSVDTGTAAETFGADGVRINGPEPSYINYVDDFKVISGACPWAYE